MKSRSKYDTTAGLIDALLGDEDRFPLERRIFNAVTFSSGIIALIILITTLFLRLPLIAILLVAGALINFSIIYAIGRIKKEVKWLAWVYILTTYAIVLFDWCYVGGLGGIAVPVSIAIAGIIPMILRPEQTSKGILSLVLLLVSLYLISIFFSEEIPKQQYTLQYLTDKMADVSVLALGLAMMTYLVVKTNRVQSKKIKTLNRVLEKTNQDLQKRNQELEDASSEIKNLQGIIPICSYCKKVRNDKGYYEAVEAYISRQTEADFSHTLCPDCFEKHYSNISQQVRDAVK